MKMKNIAIILALTLFAACGGAGEGTADFSSADMPGGRAATSTGFEFVVNGDVAEEDGELSMELGDQFEFQMFYQSKLVDALVSCDVVDSTGNSLSEEDGGYLFCDAESGFFAAPDVAPSSGYVRIKLTIATTPTITGYVAIYFGSRNCAINIDWETKYQCWDYYSDDDFGSYEEVKMLLTRELDFSEDQVKCIARQECLRTYSTKKIDCISTETILSRGVGDACSYNPNIFTHDSENGDSEDDSIEEYNKEFVVGIDNNNNILKVAVENNDSDNLVLRYFSGNEDNVGNIEWSESNYGEACSDCKSVELMQVVADNDGVWYVLLKAETYEERLYIVRVEESGGDFVETKTVIVSDEEQGAHRAKMAITDSEIHVVYVNQIGEKDNFIYYDRCDLETLDCGNDKDILAAGWELLDVDIAADENNIYVVGSANDGRIYFTMSENSGDEFNSGKILMMSAYWKSEVRIFAENERIDIVNFGKTYISGFNNVVRQISSSNNGSDWSSVNILSTNIPHGAGDFKLAAVKIGNDLEIAYLRARSSSEVSQNTNLPEQREIYSISCQFDNHFDENPVCSESRVTNVDEGGFEDLSILSGDNLHILAGNRHVEISLDNDVWGESVQFSE